MANRYVVVKSWRDSGPSVSPSWRLWSGWVEDRRNVYETCEDAEDNQPALRSRLEAVGLVVVLIEPEPICDHDLSTMDENEGHAHLFEPAWMGGCDQTYLAANVRIPARDHQHAYEQVCRALGEDPDGEATESDPPRSGMATMVVNDG